MLNSVLVLFIWDLCGKEDGTYKNLNLTVKILTSGFYSNKSSPDVVYSLLGLKIWTAKFKSNGSNDSFEFDPSGGAAWSISLV